MSFICAGVGSTLLGLLTSCRLKTEEQILYFFTVLIHIELFRIRTPVERVFNIAVWYNTTNSRDHSLRYPF